VLGTGASRLTRSGLGRPGLSLSRGSSMSSSPFPFSAYFSVLSPLPLDRCTDFLLPLPVSQRIPQSQLVYVRLPRRRAHTGRCYRREEGGGGECGSGDWGQVVAGRKGSVKQLIWLFLPISREKAKRQSVQRLLDEGTPFEGGSRKKTISLDLLHVDDRYKLPQVFQPSNRRPLPLLVARECE
jgi:hypothetical protein